MAITLPTGITHGSKSRISDPKFHPRVDAKYNYYYARHIRNHRYNYLWFKNRQVDRRKRRNRYNKWRCNWRNLCFWSSLSNRNSWRSIFSRNNNQSSKSSLISFRNSKRYRNYFYYYFLIYLLAIGLPVKAEEGETNNVSNPVAAATGNVTNQAVQFQNNGAPSRQHYGPNISCNGSTMTFSPFYMGNHVKPLDENMIPQSYTMTENWGFQVNFMVPLDKRGLEQCRRIAKRREEDMRLNHEMARFKACAGLMQKGFMIKPTSDFNVLCHDLIPISTYLKQQAAKNPQPPKKPWWHISNPFKK